MTKRSKRSRSTPRASRAPKASKARGGPQAVTASGASKRGRDSGTSEAAHRRPARLTESQWFWPTLIFALALTLRIIYVLQIRHTPFFQTLGLDAKFYDQWARDLVRGEGPSGAFFMSPLYPYFLALIYRLFGRDLALVRLIQAGIGSLSAVLVYLLARDVFDPATIYRLAQK